MVSKLLPIPNFFKLRNCNSSSLMIACFPCVYYNARNACYEKTGRITVFGRDTVFGKDWKNYIFLWTSSPKVDATFQLR